MPLRDEPLGQIAPKQHVTWYEKFIGVVLILICVGLYVTFHQNQNIQDNQKAGEQRTYGTRAFICDQDKGIGLTEPSGCDDLRVMKYRDSNVVPASSASSRATKKFIDLVCAANAASPKPAQSVTDLCNTR